MAGSTNVATLVIVSILLIVVVYILLKKRRRDPVPPPPPVKETIIVPAAPEYIPISGGWGRYPTRRWNVGRWGRRRHW